SRGDQPRRGGQADSGCAGTHRSQCVPGLPGQAAGGGAPGGAELATASRVGGSRAGKRAGDGTGASDGTPPRLSAGGRGLGAISARRSAKSASGALRV